MRGLVGIASGKRVAPIQKTYTVVASPTPSVIGDTLAREWAERGLPADVIASIPDASRLAAQVMGERPGMANREGSAKNLHYGRIFIKPDTTTRNVTLRLPLHPIRALSAGRRVQRVDDSVVRGSTMRRIAGLVQSLGPKQIHVAVCSPPIKHPCFYGIDMPTDGERIANTLGTEDRESTLRSHFGVDSVTYLSRQGLATALGKNSVPHASTGTTRCLSLTTSATPFSATDVHVTEGFLSNDA